MTLARSFVRSFVLLIHTYIDCIVAKSIAPATRYGASEIGKQVPPPDSKGSTLGTLAATTTTAPAAAGTEAEK